MKNINWKDETILLQLKELVEKGLSSKEIASVMTDNLGRKVGDRAVRRISQENNFKLQKSNNNGYNSQDKVQEERHSDGTIDRHSYLEMSEAEMMDDNFILKAHGFNPETYKIINIKNSFWQQGTKDGNKSLYASKITVKPIVDDFSIDKVIERLTQEVKPYHLSKKKLESQNNMVLPLADMHFGITKLHDLERHIDNILPKLKQEHDIFVIEQLGDLFHSSQMWLTQTMKGTLLDEVDMVEAVDDAKAFFDIIIKNINANTIIIKQMAGNHSGNMEYMFMEYLKAKYPDIRVDNNVKYRDAYLLGNVGIMMAHGDFARKGLVSLFPNEFKKIWGLSEQAYIHSGHFHTQKTTDEGGIVWQQFGTIKPNDKYEISNGWTLSKKTLYLLEYSQDALVAEYYV